MKFFIPTVGERYRLLEDITLEPSHGLLDLKKALGMPNEHVPSSPYDRRYSNTEQLTLPAGIEFVVRQLYVFSSWGQSIALKFNVNKRKPTVYLLRDVLHQLEVEKI